MRPSLVGDACSIWNCCHPLLLPCRAHHLNQKAVRVRVIASHPPPALWFKVTFPPLLGTRLLRPNSQLLLIIHHRNIEGSRRIYEHHWQNVSHDRWRIDGKQSKAPPPERRNKGTGPRGASRGQYTGPRDNQPHSLSTTVCLPSMTPSSRPASQPARIFHVPAAPAHSTEPPPAYPPPLPSVAPDQLTDPHNHARDRTKLTDGIRHGQGKEGKLSPNSDPPPPAKVSSSASARSSLASTYSSSLGALTNTPGGGVDGPPVIYSGGGDIPTGGALRLAPPV